MTCRSGSCQLSITSSNVVSVLNPAWLCLDSPGQSRSQSFLRCCSWSYHPRFVNNIFISSLDRLTNFLLTLVKLNISLFAGTFGFLRLETASYLFPHFFCWMIFFFLLGGGILHTFWILIFLVIANDYLSSPSSLSLDFMLCVCVNVVCVSVSVKECNIFNELNLSITSQ